MLAPNHLEAVRQIQEDFAADLSSYGKINFKSCRLNIWESERSYNIRLEATEENREERGGSRSSRLRNYLDYTRLDFYARALIKHIHENNSLTNSFQDGGLAERNNK